MALRSGPQLSGFHIGAALFVFYTSWPRTSADKKLSAAALFLFSIGGLRYVLKVQSLRSASFGTMSNSSNKAKKSPDKDREEDTREYIKRANEIVMNSRVKTVSQKVRDKHQLKLSEVVDKLFVDVYVYPYSERLARLKCFWELKEEEAYKLWPETVAQHSIIGDLAMNKKGTSTIRRCMEYLYKYCFLDYCRSSKDIIGLVREHIKAG
ncbi:hypothetical protein VPH35_034998 [Triticum aestivum]|uniref:DUF4220 domain-containing protein n=1 Tax=Aegilops tauschii TaxID=37682 RepID=M8D8U8_AEGTA